MKVFFKSPKWLLPFVLTAFIGASIFTGCAPGDSGNPTSVKELQQPGIAAPANMPDQADYGQAVAAQNRHTDALLERDGIIGTGIGRDKNGNTAIYIYTSKPNVAHIPDKIEEFPTVVENIGVVEAFAVYTGVYRNPLYSGVSIGNDRECAAGTLGCVVSDAAGNKYILSNNHVMARQNSAAIGEDIDQPGRYELNCGASTPVADLSSFVKIIMKRNANNVVDAAIAKFNGAYGQTSQVADLSYTPTNTPVAATIGMNVQKVGRTTGHTFGSVQSTNATILVQYSRGVARFVNQIVITPGTFSAAGDSGSLIVLNGGTGPHPVGLLFAGSSASTIANPIQSVLNAFNVTMN